MTESLECNAVCTPVTGGRGIRQEKGRRWRGNGHQKGKEVCHQRRRRRGRRRRIIHLPLSFHCIISAQPTWRINSHIFLYIFLWPVCGWLCLCVCLFMLCTEEVRNKKIKDKKRLFYVTKASRGLFIFLTPWIIYIWITLLRCYETNCYVSRGGC